MWKAVLNKVNDCENFHILNFWSVFIINIKHKLIWDIIQNLFWILELYKTNDFNTLRPRQDRHHFADDIFTCIFFNENCCILIKFSLKYVRKGPIDNNSVLVQIMTWRQSGDKPLSEPMMINLPRIYASLGPNELRKKRTLGYVTSWEMNHVTSLIDWQFLPSTHCGLVTPYGNRSGSILAQVMALCLLALSHYLNQCWFFIIGALWHSPKTNSAGIAQDINS